MIISICPFCNSPIFGRWVSEPESSEGYYDLSCQGSDGHFYGVHAATEEEARAIVLKPQKTLTDALSARIALPLEQRRHNKARQRIGKFLFYVQQVHDRFKKDIEQGFKTRDKEYVIEMLGKALEEK